MPSMYHAFYSRCAHETHKENSHGVKDREFVFITPEGQPVTAFMKNQDQYMWPDKVYVGYIDSTKCRRVDALEVPLKK